jgi:molecular chaperone GrpE
MREEKKQTPAEVENGGAEWKKILCENFNKWVEEIDSQSLETAHTSDPPDLYSFYEELCILRSNVRKDARRNHDAFTRFSDALNEFHEMVKPLSQMTHRIETEMADDRGDRKALLIALAEIFERIKRIEKKFAQPPESGFFSPGKKWVAAWQTLADGLVILKKHFEQLLYSQGITPMETHGRPFDPLRMKAVEIVANGSAGPNTVIEEIAGGYLHHGQVIKFAEVRLAGRKENVS